jgi:hypothetical protein
MSYFTKLKKVSDNHIWFMFIDHKFDTLNNVYQGKKKIISKTIIII